MNGYFVDLPLEKYNETVTGTFTKEQLQIIMYALSNSYRGWQECLKKTEDPDEKAFAEHWSKKDSQMIKKISGIADHNWIVDKI